MLKYLDNKNSNKNLKNLKLISLIILLKYLIMKKLFTNGIIAKFYILLCFIEHLRLEQILNINFFRV